LPASLSLKSKHLNFSLFSFSLSRSLALSLSFGSRGRAAFAQPEVIFLAASTTRNVVLRSRFHARSLCLSVPEGGRLLLVAKGDVLVQKVIKYKTISTEF
jgi:hypothetical protein